MRRKILTSIRNERPALVALGCVTLVSIAVFVATVVLGDQRRFEVLLATPATSAQVASTTRILQLTFNVDADHKAVENALQFDPPLTGSVRWRGRTMEFVLAGPLAVGSQQVRLNAGILGAHAERLAEPYVLSFDVRKPGVVLVVDGPTGQRLVSVREGQDPKDLASAPRIRDFAVSPDGVSVAVITAEQAPPGSRVPPRARLLLVDSGTGESKTIVDAAAIDVGSVSWSADGQALLVVRRDLLPDGSQSVPRTWLLRLSGEFAGPIDPEGNPTQSAVWSPDAQSIAYISPSTGELLVRNLSTQKTPSFGNPRGGAPAWSPDSKLIAFESAPDAKQAFESSIAPLQGIRLRSLDGEIDRTFGVPGEVRSQPRFLDNSTLMSLRQRIGPSSPGVELVFESVDKGSLLRSVLLTVGQDQVTSWDLDPSGKTVVYGVQAGSVLTVLTLDLDSGKRTPLEVTGSRPTWLP